MLSVHRGEGDFEYWGGSIQSLYFGRSGEDVGG